MGKRGRRFSSEHPSELRDPLVAMSFDESGEGAVIPYFFGNHKMAIGAAGDLREMGDANHLVFPAQTTHFATNRIGNFSADIGIDFVKHE